MAHTWLALSLFLALAAPPKVPAVIEGMDLLYGEHVPLLATGEPLTTIGLATGQTEVRLMTHGRVGLEYIERGLRKQTVVPPRTALRITLSPHQPQIAAKRIYYVDVQGIGQSAPEPAQAAMAVWRHRGLGDITMIWDGSAFAFNGRTLDTRTQRLVVPMPTLKAAQSQAAALSKRFGVTARTQERLAQRPDAELQVTGPTGALALAHNYARIFALDNQGIEVENVEFGQGYSWHGQQTRTYRGDIYVVVDPNAQLAVVNAVGIETMLQGVVPAELYASAPQEALRAQAVAARNTVLAKLGHRHHDAPFHLCAEQHCQVYAGTTPEDPRAHTAIQATYGQALFHRGRLVDAVYSSSCGGHTENNDAAWGDSANPALRGRFDTVREGVFTGFGGLGERQMADFVRSPPDTYCGSAPKVRADKYRWVKDIEEPVLRQMFGAMQAQLGRLKDVIVMDRAPGGRVVALRLIGDAGAVVVRHELPIRQLLGNLNSAAFVLDVSHDRAGFVRRIRLEGGGWGHGVGMCQMGAMGRAAHGHSFDQILGHYYNGARVEALWGPASHNASH